MITETAKNNAPSDGRKTLKSALESLQYRGEQMDMLVKLSNKLRSKLYMTEEIEKVHLQENQVEAQTIVELFLRVSDDLETKINAIGKALDDSVRIID